MNKAIISVHVPRTAGTSFAGWLESVVGSGRIVRDYADRPIDPKSEMNVDPAGFLSRHGAARQLPTGAMAVHGHFWAKKYERTENAIRITFLRDPIERTISHYHFWRTTPGDGHSLHQRVLDEGMGMLDFARLPQMRGCYRDYIFRDVNMADFDFIGDMSFFDEELGRLEALLGVRGARATAGRNPAADYSSMREVALATGPLRAELAEILTDEIAFYRQHLGR
ncbi:MAG: sulfotransferase family 2 domain-containing protein [Methylocella sp.]